MSNKTLSPILRLEGCALLRLSVLVFILDLAFASVSKADAKTGSGSDEGAVVGSLEKRALYLNMSLAGAIPVDK